MEERNGGLEFLPKCWWPHGVAHPPHFQVPVGAWGPAVSRAEQGCLLGATAPWLWAEGPCPAGALGFWPRPTGRRGSGSGRDRRGCRAH